MALNDKTQPLQIQFLNFIFLQDGLQILFNQPSAQYFMMFSCSANCFFGLGLKMKINSAAKNTSNKR